MPDGKSVYLPSDKKKFRKAIRNSLSLFEDIDSKKYLSPYSVVPLISQILGLNTPLFGSGDSPYSIMSISFELRKKKRLFDRLFDFPVIEKRRIVDEIYDMTAPAILGEKDEYIRLLADTKYKKLLRTRSKTREFIKNCEEKFSSLQPLIHKFDKKTGDFAHIVHYGHPEDLYREYAFLERIPKTFAKKWRERSYPVVTELVLKGFPSSSGKDKKEIAGWIIFISNYTEELLYSHKLRKQKILQAAKLAKKLGAKIIGMGGLIASFAQGGAWLSEQIPGVGFTTGHAYTIANITEIMDTAVKKVRLNIKKLSIAIVGAAGSIGSGCAKLAAERNPASLILIDVNAFDVAEKLRELKNYIYSHHPRIAVDISLSLPDIKRADIVIVATNSPVSIIKKEHLKKGAIVIDDSFPKNVTKELLNQRKDVLLLEGGIMRLPLSIDIKPARNMPDLLDLPLTRAMSVKEVYGCFAETITLGLYGWKRNYGLGYSDPRLAKDILAKAKKRGFNSAPLQCFDEAVEEERFGR